MLAKKPISLGMTITLATSTLDQILHIPGVEELLVKKFSEVSAGILTPEEFDIHWDMIFKQITGEKKKADRES